MNTHPVKTHPVNTHRFDERVAVVTGAGRGIGREHALLLAARGAAVVVNDFGGEADGTGGSVEPTDEVVESILAAGGTAVASYESVADADGPAAIVSRAIDEFGRLDIVINNAGIMIPGYFEELTLDNFRTLFDVHVMGTIAVTQAAWPHFTAASYGRIVNTASPTFVGMAGLSGYATMKGAIVSFTKSVALEGARHGIRANIFAPSAWSRMALVMPERIFSKANLERMRTTRDPRLVAPVAAFLAHESCELSGEILYAGGGAVDVYRIEMSGRGFSKPDLTIEDVAAEMGALTAESN